LSAADQKKLQDTLDNWPLDASDTLIWDKEHRKSLFDSRISEYHLNIRRQNNLVPGTKLEPTPEDSKIPLLLVQRGGPMYNKSDVNQKPLSTHEFVEGWTVIIPRGFGLAFWKSLIFAGARVAGYKDVRAMHFESGFPCFPQDYPGTRAFESQRLMDKKAAEAIWEKKPPAKRVNFAKRGINHPFECAFETLSSTDHMSLETENNLVARPNYSLIHGNQLISSLLNDTDYVEKLNTLIAKRGLKDVLHAPNIQLDDLLVKMRLKYIGRGKPASNALIYLLEDLQQYDSCTKYIRQKLPNGKRKFEDSLDDNANETVLKTC
jgi:ribonuclease P/MRP protein subunit POP1